MSTRTLFTTLLFAAVFTLALRPPLDPDMWWHLKTGQYIFQNGIPTTDPNFSLTAAGQPWIAHEWLTDLLMAAVYGLGGLAGLTIFFSLLIALGFAFLFLASDGRPFTAGAVTLWGVAASLPFLGARPQMINLLGGAAIVYLIERVRAGRVDSRWLWAIPALMVLWVNMHGGFLLGLAIMGVYLVGDGLQQYLWADRHEGLPWPAWLTLAGAAAASPFTSLLNPYGIEMWTYAYRTTLTSEAMQTYILEWRSPDFQLWYFWIFGFLMMATWSAMIFSRRPVTLTDLLFIIGTGYAALSSMRNIPIFVVVAVPILSRHLVGCFEGSAWYPLLSGRRPETALPPRLHIINLVLAGVFALAAIIYSAAELRTIPEKVAESFPVEALAFIKTGEIDAVFNEYAWGGYLIWQDFPAFIDGRADLYGDDFLHFTMQAFRTRTDWQAPFDRYKIDYALLRTDSELDILLAAAPAWRSIYRDEVAVVYQRSSP